MLTDEQDQQLERVQASALRCIYGYEVPYSRMRVLAEVKTLRSRRIEACDKLAASAAASARFAHWFPRRRGTRTVRGGEKYQEEHARCNRLRDIPIFYMRRRLNGKEGKRYGERNREYREGDKVSMEMNPARRKRPLP